MKTVAAFLFCLLLGLPGCLSGPSFLSRSVDDAMNKSYAESPVGTAMFTDILPLYPLVKFLAVIPDVLILNPIQFWGFDIWEGRGAAFEHSNPISPNEIFFQ